MANKDSAFGLRAIGKVGQNRDNQGLSEYSVNTTTSTIYFQDPVKAVADGGITVAGAGDLLLGSLNGIFYTDNHVDLYTPELEAKRALYEQIDSGSRYGKIIDEEV